MHKLWLSLLLILGYSSAKTDRHEVLQDTNKGYYGRWKITDIYFNKWMISGENFLTEEESRTYLNSLVALEKESIALFGKNCIEVEYTEEQKNSFDHFYGEYKLIADTINGRGTRGLNKAVLGIETDTVRVIEIECDSQFYRFYPINRNRAIIENKKVFFHLRRK